MAIIPVSTLVYQHAERASSENPSAWPSNLIYQIRHSKDISSELGFSNSSQSSLESSRLVYLSTVSMAEWSKAPDSSSGLRKGAWVRTPLLTSALLSHLENIVYR
jgi:hypothetical protein